MQRVLNTWINDPQTYLSAISTAAKVSINKCSTVHAHIPPLSAYSIFILKPCICNEKRLGCSSVIEYSRNLIWPPINFFYIKCLMLIFIWYAYKFK